MITETDVREAVFGSLPKESFVRRYVEYVSTVTTSPLGYQLLTGLTILGATVPTDYHIYYASKLRANMFSLLVGRSGEDMKSTAANIGSQLLEDTGEKLIGRYFGSAEGMVDSLRRQPRQLVTVSEFGKLLAAAQRGYYESIKAALADAWDCLRLERVKANDKVVTCENPRLSMLAACSLPYLEKYTDAADWSGGFMGRWAVIYQNRERTDPFPQGDHSLRASLIEDLQERAVTLGAGPCKGFDGPTRRWWDAWFHDTANRDIPSAILGVRARAPTIALKVALIYAWDYGPARTGEPWYITEDLLEPALAFTELHIRSIVALSSHICEHADARLRRSVMETIREAHADVSMGYLLERLKLRRKPIQETLDALIESGIVARHNISGTMTFSLPSTKLEGLLE